MIERFFTLVSEYPNWTATIFGGVGVIATAFFGYLLKRPMQRQAVASELFKSQIQGYDAILNAQALRIAHLEQEQILRDQYHTELLQRLRACEERNLRQPMIGKPGDQ